MVIPPDPVTGDMVTVLVCLRARELKFALNNWKNVADHGL